MLVLLAASQLLMLLVRMAAGGTYPGISFFVGSVIAAVLWPLVTFVAARAAAAAGGSRRDRPI